MPIALWLSQKTGNIYIDIINRHNSRIQLWKQNATESVTIAGSPLGQASSTTTLLSGPNELVVNANETIMYVSDAGNKRIQNFQLI